MVLITVIGDMTNEADETFTVALSSPVNATLGTTPDTVTIVDNDPLPAGVPIFNVKDVKKREGSSGTTTLTFTVTRSDDTTIDGDGRLHGVERDRGRTVRLRCGPGRNVLLPSRSDEEDLERDREGRSNAGASESLFLTLNNPSIGAIEDGQGTGTIVNDDTKTTVVIKIRAAKHLVAVHGRVSPARPRKHAVVRLYRKRNGVWVRIATKRPLLRGTTDSNKDGFTDSRYATSFMRAKRGSCKIVASYPGDPNFSGSTATKLFRC